MRMTSTGRLIDPEGRRCWESLRCIPYKPQLTSDLSHLIPSRQSRTMVAQNSNDFLGQELKYFSQAGFDLDRIHIKVSEGECSGAGALAACHRTH